MYFQRRNHVFLSLRAFSLAQPHFFLAFYCYDTHTIIKGEILRRGAVP
jgi:hypothetical protein